MDSIDFFLRVYKEDICLLSPFFEAFEGMAAIRTPKPEEGARATIHLMVSPDFKKEFDRLITFLKGKFDFELVNKTAHPG